MRPVEQVRTTIEGPVTILELARPQTGNALAGALVEELTRALAQVRVSSRRAAVLTGAGKHFCTGADLAELDALAEASAAERVADASQLGALYASLLRLPQLTIAAVRGAAYGGGAGLAAACDIVIAAPGASFQFSELRLGFVPALISVFLPRRMPVGRLFQLFADPRPVPAAEALALGLVDEVVDDPVGRSREVAVALAAKTSPSAVAATKELLLGLAFPHLDQQLAHAAQVNAAQRAHAECRRGVAQFLASHRFPDWLENS